MTHRASTTRLAAILAAAVALTGAFAPAAASARPPIYVNPSTGYPSYPASEDKPISVNPSTGFASGAEAPESSSEPMGAARMSQAALDPGPSADGFDWPSAGIGAAVSGAFLLIVLAATTTVTGRGRGPLARRRAVRT